MGADKVATTEGKKAIIAAVAKTDFEGVTGKVQFDSKGDTTNKAITVYIGQAPTASGSPLSSELALA